MDDSYRLKALKALTAHLQLIKHIDGDPENDYGGFDLSNAVFRGRTLFDDVTDPKTMVCIVEAPRPDEGLVAGAGEARSEQWNLLVQGWAPDDMVNPTDPLYGLMQVVEMQLQKVVAINNSTGAGAYPGMYRLNNTISDFAFGPGVVRQPNDGISKRAFFYLPVRMGLVKDAG